MIAKNDTEDEKDAVNVEVIEVPLRKPQTYCKSLTNIMYQ
jgi:hypothetical protein